MNQFLLYFSTSVAILAFFLCCYACVRVGRLINSVKGLDWDTIAYLTGDIGTIKKSIQTLNNRINGLNSPKIDQELQNYMIQMKNGSMQPKEKDLGG